jgi:hypothetical protein
MEAAVGSMLFIASVVDADAGLLGALIGADLTTVNLPIPHDPITRLHRAETTGTGTFVLRCSLLDH